MELVWGGSLVKKGDATEYWLRVQKMELEYLVQTQALPLCGCVDLGQVTTTLCLEGLIH